MIEKGSKKLDNYKLKEAKAQKEFQDYHEKDKKEMCIIRESNTGLVDGNDEFYH
jgi:cobyrinic acid a,c-diamide synthase